MSFRRASFQSVSDFSVVGEKSLLGQKRNIDTVQRVHKAGNAHIESQKP